VDFLAGLSNHSLVSYCGICVCRHRDIMFGKLPEEFTVKGSW